MAGVAGGQDLEPMELVEAEVERDSCCWLSEGSLELESSAIPSRPCGGGGSEPQITRTNLHSGARMESNTQFEWFEVAPACLEGE